jgi:uncharacterized protein (TIGR02266 family)
MSNDTQAQPLRLTVRFREQTREAVIAGYCADVMKGGMFIRTRQNPLIALGTGISLRFLLGNGEEIFSGVGLVAWLQQSGAQLGVGVQFKELSREGEQLYREMLAEREVREIRERERFLADQDKALDDEWFDGPTIPRGEAAETARVLSDTRRACSA